MLTTVNGVIVVKALGISCDEEVTVACVDAGPARRVQVWGGGCRGIFSREISKKKREK